MANERQRDALGSIGRHLRMELERKRLASKPSIDRALRRLLERDMDERLRRARIRDSGRRQDDRGS